MIQTEIHKWHESTFGPTSPELDRHMILKLQEEIEEYREDPTAEEQADVTIVLLAIGARCGIRLMIASHESLHDAVHDKFEVVKNRDQVRRDEERGLGVKA